MATEVDDGDYLLLGKPNYAGLHAIPEKEDASIKRAKLFALFRKWDAFVPMSRGTKGQCRTQLHNRSARRPGHQG